MRLRYVGAAPTTFITGSVGTVQPGDEFTVADELALSFTARADVEEVVEAAKVETEKVKTPRRRPRDVDPEPSSDGTEGP